MELEDDNIIFIFLNFIHQYFWDLLNTVRIKKSLLNFPNDFYGSKIVPTNLTNVKSC